MKLVKFAFLGMALVAASHTFAAKPATNTQPAPVEEAPVSEVPASEVQANDTVVTEAQPASSIAAQ